jgi:NAD(P)-dependent dehydrogenase (short-subunit alcohol dehydrogenase family)
MNPFSLEGKSILITGASSGIGAQCAIDCSKMGAKVILIARNEERLKSVLSQCVGEIHAYYLADMAEIVDKGAKPLLEQIVSEHGKLDGFIHSAGIQKTAPLKLLSMKDYEEVIKVNTLSAFEMLKYLSNIKYMNAGGHIVLIASITGVIGRSGLAAYSASKGALISAVRSIALELAQRGICINCVSPGTILTPLMQAYLDTLDENKKMQRVDGFPLGLGKTTDISNACIYLLSDASRWVTGQNFVIDGGYTAR